MSQWCDTLSHSDPAAQQLTPQRVHVLRYHACMIVITPYLDLYLEKLRG